MYPNASPTFLPLAGSALLGVWYSSGPFVAIALDKYGCRLVVVSGLIICLSSMILCYLTEDFWTYTVCYGLTNGVGMGCVYIASFTSLGFYFDQWVSFAAGLANAGSSFGYLILPPIESYLIEAFGWSTIFIFEGAVMIALIPLALLLPTVQEIEKQKIDLTRRRNSKKKSQNEEENKPVSYSYIMKQPLFWILMLGYFCFALVQWTLTGMLPKLTETKFNSTAGGRANALITSFSIASFFVQVQ